MPFTNNYYRYEGTYALEVHYLTERNNVHETRTIAESR